MKIRTRRQRRAAIAAGIVFGVLIRSREEYAEYLRSDWWRKKRRHKLDEVQRRCQNCKANGSTLCRSAATTTEGHEVSEARYSVGTWDTEEQAYTPQTGVPAFNLTLGQLLGSLRMLRNCGYSAHRLRDEDGGHENNDWSVLVERTTGMTEKEILESWKR